MNQSQVLVISGPTSSGKTSLAIKLAQKFNGELISADSRQVYSQMDIVTGKDIDHQELRIRNQKLEKSINIKLNHLNERGQAQSSQGIHCYAYQISNISIHGLDLVTPNQDFHASSFVLVAQELIKDIQIRNKLPIIVGGTGFYINSLINPPETIQVPINNQLRKELDSFSTNSLQEKLKDLDHTKYNKMNHSDQCNPRRLVRAIEVAQYHKKKSKNFQKEKKQKNVKYDYLHISLLPDVTALEQKINNRVSLRIQDGAIQETKKLLEKYNSNIPSMSALGYKEIIQYLNKKISKKELIRIWTLHELQYAKRQLTWFKKLKNVTFVDIEKKDYNRNIVSTIQNWQKSIDLL